MMFLTYSAQIGPELVKNVKETHPKWWMPRQSANVYLSSKIKPYLQFVSIHFSNSCKNLRRSYKLKLYVVVFPFEKLSLWKWSAMKAFASHGKCGICDLLGFILHVSSSSKSQMLNFASLLEKLPNLCVPPKKFQKKVHWNLLACSATQIKLEYCNFKVKHFGCLPIHFLWIRMFLKRTCKKSGAAQLESCFPNQCIILWAEVFISLKVQEDLISDAAEESNLSRLYSKFAKQKCLQELSGLVARTGGDIPNTPPYEHNKA